MSGGSALSGPIALLSVLDPRPVVLLYHFFAVAFYATFDVFRSVSLPRALWLSGCIIGRACAIIFPLIASELRRPQ